MLFCKSNITKRRFGLGEGFPPPPKNFPGGHAQFKFPTPDLRCDDINIRSNKDTTGTDITGSDDSPVGEDGAEVEDSGGSEDSIGLDDFF